MQKLVKVWQVGRIGYLQSLKLQRHLVDLHHSQRHLVNSHHSNEAIQNTLLLVEHPPVYTIGLRTKDYTFEDEKKLRETGLDIFFDEGFIDKVLGAEFFKTNRGGLITFHGPGQLVAYPILNLKDFKTSMKWYVCHIEKSIIHLCETLGLKAETSPHTGVWIGDNKICAIGVHGSRYITSHGLALNCCTDLEWFDHIEPCGIKDKGVTTLSKELGRRVSIEEIVPLFLHSFSEVFGCSYTDFPYEESYQILQEN